MAVEEKEFYLGQTRRPGAHQDERSKETYHVYVYTRPARCHTRTQQNDVYTHKDLRHIGQGAFISKYSTKVFYGRGSWSPCILIFPFI